MAKFELIKVVKPASPEPQIYWYTQKDDWIINGSLSFDYNEAKKAFHNLIQSEVQQETKEVIETYETHENGES